MSQGDEATEIANRLTQILGLSGGSLTAPVSIPVPRAMSLTKDNESILDLARENQTYYLEQAAKTEKPWLTLPRHSFQYSEFILTTPMMAQVALERNKNPRNRLKKQSIAKYSRDMIADAWLPTHESIGIDVANWMFDGQHRMHALIAAGKPVVLYYTFNTSQEARFAVDMGCKRSATEKLELIMENRIGNKLPAICRAMMRGIDEATSFSEAEIAHVASLYGDVIERVAKALQFRADALAPIVKAVLYYGQEAMQGFIDTLSSLSWGDNDGHPCKRLYLYLKINCKGVNNLVVYKKTLSAIEHYRSNSSIRALYERHEDIFVWGENWSIPSQDT